MIEESKEAEKPEEESETTNLEAQKSEVPPTPESFVDATDKDETAEKTVEAAPAATATETKIEEESSEKKTEATESADKKTEPVTESELEKKAEESK